MVADNISRQNAQNQVAQVILWMDLIQYIGVDNVLALVNSDEFVRRSIKIFKAHGMFSIDDYLSTFTKENTISREIYDAFFSDTPCQYKDILQAMQAKYMGIFEIDLGSNSWQCYQIQK